MFPNNKPLYALTVGEFTELAKQLVEESLKENEQKRQADKTDSEEKTDTFSIM